MFIIYLLPSSPLPISFKDVAQAAHGRNSLSFHWMNEWRKEHIPRQSQELMKMDAYASYAEIYDTTKPFKLLPVYYY